MVIPHLLHNLHANLRFHRFIKINRNSFVTAHMVTTFMIKIPNTLQWQ